MGIANLNKFLRKNCPQIFQEVHISNFAFQQVAIDTSLYMCKFKAICGDTWLTQFIKLVSSLRRNEIHCVFIYDSSAPADKDAERAERSAQKEKLEERVAILEDALEHYHLTNEVLPVLVELNKKKSTRLLGSRTGLDMKVIEEDIQKMKKQILHITPEEYALTKQLFDILKVPYYQAPMEAETMCSDLCRRGIVNAVLSEDTDVLAYGAPTFLSKIDTNRDTCIQIDYNEMLEALELSAESFLDLCIMCGTDYNKNIPKVGPENAYKHIKKHDNIDAIAQNTNLDTSILRHVRVRELFTDYEKPDVKVDYCGAPDFKKLEDFVKKQNVQINIEKLRKDFVREIIIQSDSDEEILMSDQEEKEEEE